MLSTVVASAVPFHRTRVAAALLTKLVPVMVRVWSPAFIRTEVGVMATSVGCGFSMLSTIGAEVPALGAGFATVTLTWRASSQ